MVDALADFEHDTFTHAGQTRDVFRAGVGPAVIVLAEMPGITPRVLDFARRVVGTGCSVTLPHLFGEPGRDPAPGGKRDLAYLARSIVPACVAREFAALATGRTEPISSWLRALSRAEWDRAGGPGVGVVGMCWTGGFALGMMVDDHILAPVLSQPSLPIGITRRAKADLHLSPADRARVKERAESGVCVLGLRFTEDRLAPEERFATLRRELGDRFISVEIDSSPGNAWGIGALAHSVLAADLVDEPGHPTFQARQQVLDFLQERLVGPTSTTGPRSTD